jgi:hypothetical protein
MAERKLLGENLPFDERVSLAQLTTHPGWKILVKLMGEACRESTEATIKLDPSSERYPEKVVALQTTARAINKFTRELLDSVKVHNQTAITEVRDYEAAERGEEKTPNTRFRGFKPPVPKKSPTEGAVVESNTKDTN